MNNAPTSMSVDNKPLWGNEFTLDDVTVKPVGVWIYTPPIVWKGDRVGHIGYNDNFFFVLERECYLNVNGHSCIIREGQLAFLPKGKMRAYTHISERFVMYEMAFSARAGERNLMDYLGLCDDNYVVTIGDKRRMCAYFEDYCRKEMQRDPLFEIGWCSAILAIIREYAEERRKLTTGDGKVFAPVIKYMTENLDSPIKTGELAAVLFMQTTYFIRRFGEVFGMSPQSYLTKLRMSRAMELLSSTDMPIEKIAGSVGIPDTSYFSRVFRKHCGTTPGTYRATFLKNE